MTDETVLRSAIGSWQSVECPDGSSPERSQHDQQRLQQCKYTHQVRYSTNKTGNNNPTRLLPRSGIPRPTPHQTIRFPPRLAHHDAGLESGLLDTSLDDKPGCILHHSCVDRCFRGRIHPRNDSIRDLLLQDARAFCETCVFLVHA